MKKTNRFVKRTKFFKKLLKFALVQIFILLISMWLLYEAKPIKIEDIKHVSVVVDDTEYERVVRENRFRIVSDGVTYDFSEFSVFSKYSNRQLYETIEKDDVITIAYVQRYSLTGLKNWVVDARTETEVYRSLEYYASQKNLGFTGVIVIISIVESIFLLVLVLYIIYLKRFNVI